jgi:hypothetical protein
LFVDIQRRGEGRYSFQKLLHRSAYAGNLVVGSGDDETLSRGSKICCYAVESKTLHTPGRDPGRMLQKTWNPGLNYHAIVYSTLSALLCKEVSNLPVHWKGIANKVTNPDMLMLITLIDEAVYNKKTLVVGREGVCTERVSHMTS